MTSRRLLVAFAALALAAALFWSEGGCYRMNLGIEPGPGPSAGTIVVEADGDGGWRDAR